MNYSHFVGLDVGKKTFDASLMSADEKELSHKSFDNTPEGIQSLLDWIAGYHLSLSKLLFCAENMGSYVTELSVSSVSMGFSLALVCPLTIKKSIGLQRGKNDRIDAKRIANYAVLDLSKTGVAPFEHTSGISIRGKTQTSSLANKEVKVYLTRAAITAISWNPQLKAYYKREIAEGKHKASVINAVRAKIIARSFAVIRRQTPFVTLAV